MATRLLLLRSVHAGRVDGVDRGSSFHSFSEGRTLVKLATRLIVEEALEGEAGDAVGRDYYEHGAQPGHGYRNGYRMGRLKTAEGAMEYSAPQIAGRDEPSPLGYSRASQGGHTAGDWRIWRSRCWRVAGYRVRDIEDAFFKDE